VYLQLHHPVEEPALGGVADAVEREVEVGDTLGEFGGTVGGLFALGGERHVELATLHHRRADALRALVVGGGDRELPLDFHLAELLAQLADCLFLLLLRIA
jgi:hypothetical protein